MKKTIAILTALLIMFTMIFSVHFVAENSHHKCDNHNDCPICQLLESAREITTKGFVVIASIGFVFAVFFTNKTANISNVSLNNGSILILNKVRLDN